MESVSTVEYREYRCSLILSLTRIRDTVRLIFQCDSRSVLYRCSLPAGCAHTGVQLPRPEAYAVRAVLNAGSSVVGAVLCTCSRPRCGRGDAIGGLLWGDAIGGAVRTAGRWPYRTTTRRRTAALSL